MAVCHIFPAKSRIKRLLSRALCRIAMCRYDTAEKFFSENSMLTDEQINGILNTDPDYDSNEIET
jgi:hypothetical protein